MGPASTNIPRSDHKRDSIFCSSSGQISDADECKDRNRPEYHYFVRTKIHVLCHDGESQGLRACALASCIHRHTEFMDFYLPKPKRSNDPEQISNFLRAFAFGNILATHSHTNGDIGAFCSMRVAK